MMVFVMNPCVDWCDCRGYRGLLAVFKLYHVTKHTLFIHGMSWEPILLIPFGTMMRKKRLILNFLRIGINTSVYELVPSVLLLCLSSMFICTAWRQRGKKNYTCNTYSRGAQYVHHDWPVDRIGIVGRLHFSAMNMLWTRENWGGLT